MEDLSTTEENKRLLFIENITNFLGRSRATAGTLEKIRLLVYFKGNKTPERIAKAIAQETMRMRYITQQKIEKLAEMINWEINRVREYEMKKRKKLRELI